MATVSRGLLLLAVSSLAIAHRLAVRNATPPTSGVCAMLAERFRRLWGLPCRRVPVRSSLRVSGQRGELNRAQG